MLVHRRSRYDSERWTIPGHLGVRVPLAKVQFEFRIRIENVFLYPLLDLVVGSQVGGGGEKFEVAGSEKCHGIDENITHLDGVQMCEPLLETPPMPPGCSVHGGIPVLSMVHDRQLTVVGEEDEIEQTLLAGDHWDMGELSWRK